MTSKVLTNKEKAFLKEIRRRSKPTESNMKNFLKQDEDLDSLLKVAVWYHGGCNDGLGSAVSVAVFLKEELDFNLELVDFVPVGYGKPAPEVDHDFVFIVDFAYSPEDTEELCSKNKDTWFLTIDHHETAYTKFLTYYNNSAFSDRNCFVINANGNLAGADLSWMILNPHIDVPDLIKDVADRDLWKFERPSSKPMHLFLVGLRAIKEYCPVKVYYRFLTGKDSEYDEALVIGKSLLQFQKSLIREVSYPAKTGTIQMGEEKMPAIFCNCSNYSLISDTGDYILNRPDKFKIDIDKHVAILYLFSADLKQVKLSFRSKNNQAKVYAEFFGGGGHPNSGGAAISKEEFDKLVELNTDEA